MNYDGNSLSKKQHMQQFELVGKWFVETPGSEKETIQAIAALRTCMLGRFHDLYTTYVRYGPLSTSFTLSPPRRSFLHPWMP